MHAHAHVVLVQTPIFRSQISESRNPCFSNDGPSTVARVQVALDVLLAGCKISRFRSGSDSQPSSSQQYFSQRFILGLTNRSQEFGVESKRDFGHSSRQAPLANVRLLTRHASPPSLVSSSEAYAGLLSDANLTSQDHRAFNSGCQDTEATVSSLLSCCTCGFFPNSGTPNRR